MAKLQPHIIDFNRHTIGYLAGVHEYELKQFDPHHYRLFLPGGHLDYWPNTGKARWLKNPNNYFTIKDIESFINKQYKNE